MDKGDVSRKFQRVMGPASAGPISRRTGESAHRLEVAVVFTSASATIAALRKAAALAEDLTARVRMVVPQVVPYPLPLDNPRVAVHFSELRFQEIALESGVGAAVRIYLCRDSLECLKAMLAPRSLVVIGGRRRWWPTREIRLARELRCAGHEVIFEETE